MYILRNLSFFKYTKSCCEKTVEKNKNIFNNLMRLCIIIAALRRYIILFVLAKKIFDRCSNFWTVSFL